MKNKWDKYFLDICNTVSQKSNCLSRKIGAILVEDNTILCTGYNGPPRGVPHCNTRWKNDPYYISLLNQHFGDFSLNFPKQEQLENSCPRYILKAKSGEMLNLCIAGHAERNVLINAARHGISTKGKKLYMNCPVPCTPCLIEIINAGIEEIIITEEFYYDEMSDYLIKNSGLKMRIFEE